MPLRSGTALRRDGCDVIALCIANLDDASWLARYDDGRLHLHRWLRVAFEQYGDTRIILKPHGFLLYAPNGRMWFPTLSF